jgi:folate-binding protein YgfZ
MESHFESLTGAAAAIRPCPGRGILWATGGDRVRFLNGMLSQDITSIHEGESQYSTQLDRKGHILADLYVMVLPDFIVLDTAEGCDESVFEILDKHLIADDVALENRSAAWSQLAFEGPGVPQVSGIPALAKGEVREEGELLWLAGGTLSAAGVKLMGPLDAVAARAAELAEGAGLGELSQEHAEIVRLEAGLPVFGVDMGVRNFPAEAQILQAVSFTKGCYIGQEIVARIDSRGAVNKLLVQLSAGSPVERGMEIRHAAKVVGEVTSSALSPSRGPLAMGYVRREFAERGSEVEIAGIAAVVVGPDPAPDREA